MLIPIFKPEYKQQPLMVEKINSKPRDKKTHWFFLTAQSSSYIRHSPVKAGQTTVRKKHYLSWALIIQTQQELLNRIWLCVVGVVACVGGLPGFLDKDFSTDTEREICFMSTNQHKTVIVKKAVKSLIFSNVYRDNNSQVESYLLQLVISNLTFV